MIELTKAMSVKQAKAVYNAYNWAQSHGIEPIEDETTYSIRGLADVSRYTGLNDIQYEDVLRETIAVIKGLVAKGKTIMTQDIRNAAGAYIRHMGYLCGREPSTLYESCYMASTLAIAMELAREDKRLEYWGSDICITVTEQGYTHPDTYMHFEGPMVAQARRR